MERYKHYSSLKKTLKKILDSHNKWYSNEGPFASNPNEDLNGDRIFNLYEKEMISNLFQII